MANESHAGTRVTISAGGRVRVTDGGGDLFPVVIDGAYLTGRARVDAIGAESGQSVEITPEEPSVSPRFAVVWPTGLNDSLIQLHVRDPEREASDSRLPAITLEGPDFAHAHASELSWPAEREHGLFAVTVLAAPSGEVVHHRLSLAPRCHVPWDLLHDGASYRAVVREHDGREIVRPLTQLWFRAEHELPGAGATRATSPLAALAAALTSGDREADVPAEILTLDTSVDGPELAGELSRLLYDVFDRRGGVHKRANALNFSDLERLATKANGDDNVSRHVRDFLAYLSLYGVVDLYFRRHRFWDRRYTDQYFSLPDFFTPAHAEELLSLLHRSPAYAGGTFSASMLDALVTSTFDRDAAVPMLERARGANADMWNSLWIDVGASTYLSREYVDAQRATLKSAAERLATSFTLLTDMPEWSPGDYMFLCSCDRFYFRVYFPVWLQMAEYLKARRVSFHFLLNAPPDDAAHAVEAAGALRHEMGAFRGFDADAYGDNISFSTAPVPDDIADIRTFYATSRFLYARRIAEEYGGPLIISDTDMFFREDPKRFLEAIDFDHIGLSPRRGLDALKPWKRFIANVLVLPYSDRAHEQFRDLEDYVLAGLGLERTWMLDQNAIAYLAERARAVGAAALLSDVHRLGQPTAAETIKGLMQDQQRRVEDRHITVLAAGD